MAMLGVVKLVPVPRLAPPVAAAYQFKIPAEAVAPKVTVPVPHYPLGVVLVIDDTGVTVATTAVLGVELHPASVAST